MGAEAGLVCTAHAQSCPGSRRVQPWSLPSVAAAVSSSGPGTMEQPGLARAHHQWCHGYHRHSDIIIVVVISVTVKWYYHSYHCHCDIISVISSVSSILSLPFLPWYHQRYHCLISSSYRILAYPHPQLISNWYLVFWEGVRTTFILTSQAKWKHRYPGNHVVDKKEWMHFISMKFIMNVYPTEIHGNGLHTCTSSIWVCVLQSCPLPSLCVKLWEWSCPWIWSGQCEDGGVRQVWSLDSQKL